MSADTTATRIASDSSAAKSEQETVAYLSSLLTSYPDWPAKGVLFRDIFPIFQSPKVGAKHIPAAPRYTATHRQNCTLPVHPLLHCVMSFARRPPLFCLICS